MRRIQVIFAAAGMAAFLIFVTTLSAAAEPWGEGTSVSREGTASAELPEPDPSASQGTVTGGASQSELRAVRRYIDQQSRLPDYSQVVDNTSADRFDAPGWEQDATDDLAHGGSYASSGPGTPGAADARFKLNVPTPGDYALYAWWSSREENSTQARFGIETASGTKWTTVDQTKEGGFWVKIGAYDMKAGDDYVVRISPGDDSGTVSADAVALVRGVVSQPPNDLAPADSGSLSPRVAEDSGDRFSTYRASTLHRVSGRRLVRYGRRHLGTPYYLSPPSPCWQYRKEDCSCFTKIVFRRFGKYLPDSPVKQWHYGNQIKLRANLRPGDLLFWKESGVNHPITHVGMYSGHGNTLHASSYYGKVVESKMKYIKGYFGARRIRVSQ